MFFSQASPRRPPAAPLGRTTELGRHRWHGREATDESAIVALLHLMAFQRGESRLRRRRDASE